VKDDKGVGGRGAASSEQMTTVTKLTQSLDGAITQIGRVTVLTQGLKWPPHEWER